MGKIEKLITKFMSNPKDLTWDELIKILAYFGFNEINKKGKTGGSRVKFSDKEKRIINLHKPHPSNIVKQYIIKQILEKLRLWKII
ncbi:type II toxin-antitoxin system HicA family toxin [Tenacibaculum dicentrarchi]|uniref:type II toxin-antitoxin system HicA family toxin n=1 Tax=Tenacibaculum finnmarkense TaxID=2781243 RepID=UPI000C4819C0|nr:type II toxin-antitoxin system HicA family toxin [Tenacibaculum finnmarkense]MCD8414593.1 type II toxin-antitoxin system HicA family toxin [Tenacibaculum dicentrarchi]MBE7645392.1 addiction module toxin, HicA family [Tenacibaculum finnmarkense genomovar ulcerans]MCD8419888.1 type II toxin-antitoxin system HicA family toxin [Tenacibaculum dicentrarchi]MCD8437102.1 type II toxin-antitoxin system HicA family toxin [Tenacibaculum dicentrarchi]MCD8440956.1 type II toxin-antitoxin system HicA fam